MLITGKFENEHLICNDMERLYLYKQSMQICAQTGFFGHLRGSFEVEGDIRMAAGEIPHRDGFYQEFFPANEIFPKRAPIDPELANALQKVMATLRNTILRSIDTLYSFCYSDGYDGRIRSDLKAAFGLRIDTGNYAFFLRFYPEKIPQPHVYCLCYRKDWLEQHMENARKGIRFIDSSYNEKFRLEDGGRIRETATAIDNSIEKTARYIDDYHVEIGGNLYHICEYAERLEAAGKTVEPVTGKMRLLPCPL